MKNYTGFDFVQLRSAVISGSVELPQAVIEAMEKPLDYPAIDKALVPGDLVALAVHESLPQAQIVIETILDWLFQQGPEDLRISVVLPQSQQSLAASILEKLNQQHPEMLHGELPRCRVVCHDPDDQQSLGYIAASEQAEAIYLHRELVEADFVIPIYRCLEKDDPRGHDPYVVLPAFADRASMNRHAKSWFQQSTATRNTIKTITESGWLAGIQFAIATLVNQEGSIARIVSGTPTQVDRVCRESLQQARSQTALSNESSFELVVVQLVDPSGPSGWNQIASAVTSAQRWLTPTGRVVVVAPELSSVSAGIHALASDDPDEEIQQMLLGSNLEDSFAATLLRGVQSRHSIYIQSQVDSEVLESLGFASIRTPEELERLMHSTTKVGVLEY